MLDNIELVDRDSSNAKNAGRIHSNLIRLKKASFSNIVSKWNAFRLANLNKKLERENDKLDKIINTAPFGKMEEKVFAQTNKIAKLEEKIKILSRENVPANYVKSRAIKLKKDINQSQQLIIREQKVLFSYMILLKKLVLKIFINGWLK